MPTPTYTPLANITLGSSAASVTFSSISQAYRDLILIGTMSNTSGDVGVLMRFNSDSGSNYYLVNMRGDGSTTSSQTATQTGVNISDSFDSEGEYMTKTQIMDYSATDKHKTSLVNKTAAFDAVMASAVRWANTAAITSLVIAPNSSTFKAGTSFALYGVAA